jgi:2-keto-4-pentenoate hydratase/2-oxohepta-3-ene-1,7-dioic acid hydratase in catechol pathway
MTGLDGFVQIEGKFAHKLDAAPWNGGEADADPVAMGAPLCPVRPTKILCVGRNYRAHAAELGNEVPSEPLFFFKPVSSLLDPGGVVLLPPESERVEYEGELAVIIGRRARRVSQKDAMQYVFGYTLACDVTARDLQKRDGQWTRAKGFDTFCPLGPSIDTSVDLETATLELFVNGEVRQRSSLSKMVFSVAEIIARSSAVMTLEPGDVLLTGTPEGVGPLTPGDALRICCSGLEDLTFSVAAEKN